MREAGDFMDGLGLHYYTRIGDKVVVKKAADGNEIYLRDESASRGSATEFGEKECRHNEGVMVYRGTGGESLCYYG